MIRGFMVPISRSIVKQYITRLAPLATRLGSSGADLLYVSLPLTEFCDVKRIAVGDASHRKTPPTVAATTVVGLRLANVYDTRFLGEVDQGCLFF